VCRLTVLSHVGIAGEPGAWLAKNRVAEVVEQLRLRGWRVTLVAPRSAPQPFLTHPLDANLRIVPTDSPIGTVSALLHAEAVLVFGPSLRSYLATALLGKRVTLYVGNAWALQTGYPSWRLWLERLALRRARNVIAAGDAVTDHCARWSGDVTACVPLVPTEVASRIIAMSAPPKAGGIRVLFVGSMSEAKGVPAVLEAAEARPDVHFRLIGAGNRDEGPALRARAAHLPNVDLRDYAEWDDLRSAYEWASVLLLPSRVEGFPRVAYEATAFGAALVVAPVGGIPHRLAHRRDALFVRPNDAGDVVAAIDELSGSEELRAELVANAARSLATVFVKASAADQFDHKLRDRRKTSRDGRA